MNAMTSDNSKKFFSFDEKEDETGIQLAVSLFNTQPTFDSEEAVDLIFNEEDEEGEVEVEEIAEQYVSSISSQVSKVQKKRSSIVYEFYALEGGSFICRLCKLDSNRIPIKITDKRRDTGGSLWRHIKTMHKNHVGAWSIRKSRN